MRAVGPNGVEIPANYFVETTFSAEDGVTEQIPTPFGPREVPWRPAYIVVHCPWSHADDDAFDSHILLSLQ